VKTSNVKEEEEREMMNFVSIAGLLVILLVLAGGCATGEAPEDGGTSLLMMVLFLVGIFVIFYFLMIRPQRKRQKEHDSLVHDVQKGDRVITVGGIYGQIESIGQDSVVLKVESGTTIRIARESIAGRQERQ